MSFRSKEFLRVQLSAFVGGLSDFAIYAFCYKVLLISAPLSNVISGSLGAVVNFTVNRYWAFNNTKVSLASQLWKFVLVVLGSIGLKTLGICLFVDVWQFHYLLSKAIVEVAVSLGFNFIMQKYWVFKKG